MGDLHILYYAKTIPDESVLRTLKDKGIKIEVARLAVEACNLLVLGPDLFITDEITLKEDTVGFVTASAAGRGVPIVLLVRKQYLPMVLQKVKELGADSVITGPLNCNDIRGILAQLKTIRKA